MIVRRARKFALYGVLAAPLLVASSAAVASDPASPPVDRFTPVRSVISKVLSDGKAPSIAVAVVKDGEIIWEEGFGWADKERHVPSTARTAYSLASMTKPITATAVMTLSEQGKIDLDAPIERYLGGIKLPIREGRADQVTARRLMAHSAGLPTYAHFYLDGSTPAGPAEVISRYAITVYPPNTRYNYSNVGMRVVDAAIANVAHVSFGDYLRKAVFDPLGMTDSAVGLPASSPAAVRYDPRGEPIPFYLSDHPGSGDVWASAHDMARFLAFHIGTPLPGQKKILSDGSRLAMQKAQSATPASSPGEPRTDVGANWMLSTVNGNPQVWHSGGQPGVSTYMAFYPKQKLGIVVLANGSAQLFPVSQAIRRAVSPEVAVSEEEGTPPPPTPIPFKGRWTGSMEREGRHTPIVLSFDDEDAPTVQLGAAPPVALQKAAFEKGSLSGQFSTVPAEAGAGAAPQQFAIDVMPVDGALVGQVMVRRMDDTMMAIFPSFVRLRPEGQ